MQWNSTCKISEHSSVTKGEIKSPQRSCSGLRHDSGLDKETVGEDFDKHESEISLYGNSSPERQKIDEQDCSTQDSGYGSSKFYRFSQSSGVSPQKDCYSVKRSFGSIESIDEEFMELSDMVNVNAQLPTDFTSLISGSLVPVTKSKRSEEFRSLSLNEEVQTPSKIHLCESRSTKRPKPSIELQSTLPKSSVLQRSFSATEESIKCALQRSTVEPDLIGDFSKAFCLPLTLGRHQDLKAITATTVALLIKGEFSDTVSSYKIIDCRFPYEFEGGHISGATNLYTKDEMLELLNSEGAGAASSDPELRNILVFHCEFSSERGPTLCRFLRNLDRIRNKDVYPALLFPEIYLLEGGYKSFYEEHGDLCEPRAYKPMLHPEHVSDLRYFRAKSKTCGDDRLRPSNRGNFKRLGFL